MDKFPRKCESVILLCITLNQNKTNSNMGILEIRDRIYQFNEHSWKYSFPNLFVFSSFHSSPPCITPVRRWRKRRTNYQPSFSSYVLHGPQSYQGNLTFMEIKWELASWSGWSVSKYFGRICFGPEWSKGLSLLLEVSWKGLQGMGVNFKEQIEQMHVPIGY